MTLASKLCFNGSVAATAIAESKADITCTTRTNGEPLASVPADSSSSGQLDSHKS